MYRTLFKPFLDILLALIILVPLAPLLLFLCLLILLTSKGSPVFVQKRIGKNGQTFNIYKLRSMHTGADKKGPYFTAKDDPRITPLGKILRKTSLDELPQILNILFGHMSFIGPRPDSPVQESQYNPEDWKKRHNIRPGITGLAQATMRSKATPEERTHLDLTYVDNVSLWLDIKIVFATVKTVIFGRNAN